MRIARAVILGAIVACAYAGCYVDLDVGTAAETGDAGSGATTSSTTSSTSSTSTTTTTSTTSTTTGTGGEACVAGPGGTDGGAACMPAGSGSTVWSRGYGNPGAAVPSGIVVDGAGDIVVLGYLNGSVDFGCGMLAGAGGGMFVAKLDPCGACQWSRFFAGSGAWLGSVAVDASNSILVTGGFSDSLDLGTTTLTAPHAWLTLFVAKLDKQGVPLWGISAMGSGNSEGLGVAVDGKENVYVTGYYSGMMSFGGQAPMSTPANNVQEGFVMALNPGGKVSWTKSFGATYSMGTGIATDASGNVILTGTSADMMDLGCASPLASAFVAKLAASGACLWSEALPFQSGGTNGIAVDPAGDAIVTGAFAGPDSIAFGDGGITGAAPGNLFIAKLDGATGSGAWGKGFGTTGKNEGDGIAIDAAGRIFVTGALNGSVDYGGGTVTSADGAFVLASFDAGGGYRWAKVFEGHPGVREAGGLLAVDSSSHVLLTGWVSTAIDFGCGPLMSNGPKEGFVASFLR